MSCATTLPTFLVTASRLLLSDDTVEAYQGYYVYKKLVEGKRINWDWDLGGCVPTWFQEKALVLSA